MALLLATALLLLVLPKADFSDMENRPLANLDRLDPATGLDRRLESWLSDHFPFHDALIRTQATLGALLFQRQQKGVLIGRDGWLTEITTDKVTDVARANVDMLDSIAGFLDAPLTVMIIPTSAFAVDQALPPLYENAPQEDVIRQLCLFSHGQAPDTCSLLRENAELCYYRTDHHLTAEGSRRLFKGLCELWGIDAPETGEVFASRGFLGAYWSKAPLWTISSEEMTVSLPEGVTLTLDGEKKPGLIDTQALKGRNKYAAVLSATYGHAVLENPAGSGRLLVLCDSYGNALAPLLAGVFSRVDLVDPRYFSGSLSEGGKDADRILACFGINDLSTGRALLSLPLD